MLVNVLMKIGRKRTFSAFSTAWSRLIPARSARRVWSTSRMALLTTRPSRMMKPIMVSRSIGWKLTRFSTCKAITPPTPASGMVRATMALSFNERNRPAISRNRISRAIRKLLLMVSMASLRASALPPYTSVPSSGSAAFRRGSTSSRICIIAVSSETFSGGLTLSVTVRRPLTLRICPGPVVRSTRTSSPSGTTSPAGVITGVVASCSGVSQPSAFMMISMRLSPSKYSPSHSPLPKVRITEATSFRFQPTSEIRESSGWILNSGSASSGGGNAWTLAPGNEVFSCC